MAQLYIKAAPHGIDIPIQSMQGILYERLRAIWCNALSGDADYKCFARTERIPYRSADGRTGYKPAASAGGGAYEDALPDDAAKLVSFFGVGDRTFNGKGWMKQTTGHLVFFADTCALEENGYRADDEVRRKIYNVLHTAGRGFTFTEQVTGIAQVLREYGGTQAERGLYAFDMGKWHCFRYNFELVYDPQDY